MSGTTRLGLQLLGAALISACSSLPVELRHAPVDNPILVEVRANADPYIGKQVRWGGTIVAIDNDPVETRIEVVARELYRSGRPYYTDRSTGRFIADIPGFLDPAVYSEGRDITVAGTITGLQSGMIGEHEYTWPVIRVHHHYLWPLPVEYRYGYPAPTYFYDPWYPYYYYPYPPRPPISVHPPAPPRPSPLKR